MFAKRDHNNEVRCGCWRGRALY